jgi:hypothetical protein
MSQTIAEIAETFGLTIDNVAIAEHEPAFRVYKGVNQIFIGTEPAVRDFLATYEKELPGLYEGSMYGYKE